MSFGHQIRKYLERARARERPSRELVCVKFICVISENCGNVPGSDV